jgi:predicted nucleotidyltransferase
MSREARAQVERVTSDLASILGDALVGVYLHGSLALGSFSPQRSDIDIVAITTRATTMEERRRLGALMLDSSSSRESLRRPPYPLELSIVTEAQLRPWRHPTPFDFHYGESQRDRFAAGEFEPLWPEDRDLAAHITVLREAGVVLRGPSIHDVFPPVPEQDYTDALLYDLTWSRERKRGLYAVLSASRVWATLAERRVHTKLSGSLWALEHAAPEFHPLVARAIAVHSGESEQDTFADDEVVTYLDYVDPLARAIASRYVRS